MRVRWLKVCTKGKVGETYNIGGHNEKEKYRCGQSHLRTAGRTGTRTQASRRVANYADLITFVKDRPGHDARYAIDASKIERELGWVPQETFETGLRKTVAWYLANAAWWQRVLSGDYRLQRIGQ